MPKYQSINTKSEGKMPKFIKINKLTRKITTTVAAVIAITSLAMSPCSYAGHDHGHDHHHDHGHDHHHDHDHDHHHDHHHDHDHYHHHHYYDHGWHGDNGALAGALVVGGAIGLLAGATAAQPAPVNQTVYVTHPCSDYTTQTKHYYTGDDGRRYVEIKKVRHYCD